MSSQIQRRYEGAFFKPPREFKKRDARGWPIGERTELRLKHNRELNKLPYEIKNYCELRLPGCLRDKFLQWCHSKKSRFLLTDKDWQEAVRGCQICHSLIEIMPHEEMLTIVVETIAKRKSRAQ